MGIACVFAALLCFPAFAHHSHAMYDDARTVTITGTVVSFDWTNPHCWLNVTVADQTGGSAQWAIELGSTASLAQEGWRPKTVAAGDSVSVVLRPLKEDLRALSEGRNVGSFVAIALPNGIRLGDATYLK
jgi:hypothetical protein